MNGTAEDTDRAKRVEYFLARLKGWIRAWGGRACWFWIGVMLCGVVGDVVGGETAPVQTEGTRRMVERLQRWAEEVLPKTPYSNADGLKRMKAALPRTSDPMERLRLEYGVAAEYLNLGQPEECLGVVTNLVRRARRYGARLEPSIRREITQLEGVAYLRLGELENCLMHHNPESCLMPITGGGHHSERRGARNAKVIFEKLAQRDTDLGSRWLLNVAAMTLGEYPEAVDKDLLIPPSVFESEFSLPRFHDVAPQVGLAINALSGGSITEDFDGDGLLDVFMTSWNMKDQCRYLRNQGDGQFVERTEQAGILGITGGLNAVQADYNNDGWIDIYVIRGAWLGNLGEVPDSLLKNNGDGTFEDVTEEAGLLSFRPALSAVWLDANNDGWIDLFVGNETEKASEPYPCALYLNDGQGRFEEVAERAGVAVRSFVRGVVAGDYDNDGWADLYLSVLGGGNILFRNEGKGSGGTGALFRDVTPIAKVAEPQLSFPTWFWDYDNDGWLDLFACGYGSDLNAFSAGGQGHGAFTSVVAHKLKRPSRIELPRLFRNGGKGVFDDVTREARLDRALLAMGANFGDLDNDGFLDCYLGTGLPYFGCLLPNEMMRNDGGKRFQDVTTAGGFGHLQKGHGVSFADLNNDGQQDVLHNVGGAFPGDNYFDALFANPGNSNRWLTLKLTGQRSNRAAIGARIKVVVSDLSGGRREIHRVVGSGGSFGASPLRQEIGLGAAKRIEGVEIWWPVTGETNRLADLQMNRFYAIKEGETEPRAQSLPRFEWPHP